MTINRRGKKKECNFIMPIHVLNAEKKNYYEKHQKH